MADAHGVGARAEVLLAAALVSQQDVALANDAVDFAAPAHLQLAQLLQQQRAAAPDGAGAGRATFSVTFEEERVLSYC